jgi:hypothetical protein
MQFHGYLMMKKNVGSTDKLIRIILSMAIMAVGFYDPHYWWMIAVGLIPLITAIGSLCLLYSILGISTCHSDTCDS